MKRIVLAAFVVTALYPAFIMASEGKTSGQFFGDFFWNAAHHDSGIARANGVRFRRMYFTYDYTLSTAFSMRFRIDAKNSGTYEKTLLEPYIRDAYLQWRAHRVMVRLGLSPSPTCAFINRAWGYRCIEKTIVSLQKLGSSRDLGLSVEGDFDERGQLHYFFMIGNGNGQQSEDNTGKKMMASLRIQLLSNLFVEGYGDYNILPGEKYRFTSQIIIAYLTEKARAGVQLVRHIWKYEEQNHRQNIDLFSGFFSMKLAAKTWLFARFDRNFDPNPAGAKIDYTPFAYDRSSLFIAGSDIVLEGNVHVMPNLEYIHYHTEESDIIPRVTFMYNWP